MPAFPAYYFSGVKEQIFNPLEVLEVLQKVHTFIKFLNYNRTGERKVR